MKKIIIQGLGFVGSAIAIVIASKLNNDGEPLFDVTGIDLPSGTGRERIDSINSGKYPINANDSKLSSELKKAVEHGNLRATHERKELSNADVVMVSINCDLVNWHGQVKIALDHFTSSI